MRFKRETWQPTIGDKYILLASGENALAIERTDAKGLTKLLKSGKMPVLTTGYIGIQDSSKHIIEQYRKANVKQVVGEVPTELLIGKQLTYRYGDK